MYIVLPQTHKCMSIFKYYTNVIENYIFCVFYRKKNVLEIS